MQLDKNELIEIINQIIARARQLANSEAEKVAQKALSIIESIDEGKEICNDVYYFAAKHSLILARNSMNTNNIDHYHVNMAHFIDYLYRSIQKTSKKSEKEISIDNLINKSSELYNSIKEKNDKVSAIHNSIKSKRDDLNVIENEIRDIHRNATSLKEDIECLQEKIDDFDEKSEKLLTYLKKEGEKLLEYIREKEIEIDSILQDASKAGLSYSFDKMRKSSFNEMIFWGSIFILTLLSITIYSYFFILPYFPLKSSEVSLAFAARFAIIFPMVWLAWFSSKQYSQSKMIKEDYSFKYASSLAYIGYKKEMEEDEEMIQKLRNAAVENFSKNPERLLHKDHGYISPFDKIIALIMAPFVKKIDRTTDKD